MNTEPGHRRTLNGSRKTARFIVAITTLMLAPALTAAEDNNRERHDYASWAVTVWTEDRSDGLSGVGLEGDMNAGEPGRFGFNGRFRLDLGSSSDNAINDDMLRVESGFGVNYHAADALLVYVAPGVNYHDFERATFGLALEAGWRGVFGPRAEARAAVRNNFNSLVDEASAEGSVRYWFGRGTTSPEFGIHIGLSHFLDSDVTRGFVGLALR